ncbi:hypothetical protein [Metabacillus fastidiosus]|uniref:Uncharacterized protein n=1 Tax=Metabacillus fastidiosus TaxID=1458 RepID=A0ABU6P1L1_9BACI|nr:hypothetical protein [Metabacillus fastidiosus]
MKIEFEEPVTNGGKIYMEGRKVYMDIEKKRESLKSQPSKSIQEEEKVDIWY